MLQAKQVRSGSPLILLEIGGNDLFKYIPPFEFEKDLTELLQAVTSPNRTVVMFELPLFPSRMAFGEIQRRLARQSNLILIPKGFFTGILATPGGTLDGIHLSDTGHQAMADMVWALIAPAVRVQQ